VVGGCWWVLDWWWAAGGWCCNGGCCAACRLTAAAVASACCYAPQLHLLAATGRACWAAGERRPASQIGHLQSRRRHASSPPSSPLPVTATFHSACPRLFTSPACYSLPFCLTPCSSASHCLMPIDSRLPLLLSPHHLLRSFPTPVAFSPEDASHAAFLQAAAILKAQVTGVYLCLVCCRESDKCRE
jgi:hypothetical protein